MNSSFVLITCDIHCTAESARKNPVYRLYVNDELFAERTWIWQDSYLEELLQIQAPPGVYNIKLQNVTPSRGWTSMHNIQIKQGPAKLLHNKCVEIQL
jgi:hypothetical protein